MVEPAYTTRIAFPLPMAKPTSPIDFTARMKDPNYEDLTSSRRIFTDALLKCSLTPGVRQTVMAVARDYLTKIKSFSPGTVVFNWINLVGCDRNTEANDVAFELRSCVTALAHWYVAYGVKVLAVGAIVEDDEEAESRTKDAYHSFLQAAGMFEWVLKDVGDNEIDMGADMTPAVLSSWQDQAFCFAEEITICRAVGKGHRNSLIAKLCADVFHRYERIYSNLAPYDFPPMKGGRVLKWRYFVRVKRDYFEAQSLLFHCRHMWQDVGKEHGVAITGLVRASKLLKDIPSLLSKNYANADPKSSVDDIQALLWPIEQLLKYTEHWAGRLKRENDMIFFARAAADPPPLPDPQSVFTREEFQL